MIDFIGLTLPALSLSSSAINETSFKMRLGTMLSHARGRDERWIDAAHILALGADVVLDRATFAGDN